MAGASGSPPTQRSGSRPKAPEVEFSGSEINVSFSSKEDGASEPEPVRLPRSSDAPISSQAEPISLRDVEIVSSPLREVTASRRLFDLISLSDGPEGEAVSLSDLQAVFSPGHNPAPRLATVHPPRAAPSPERPPLRRGVEEEEPEGTTAPLPPVAARPRLLDEPVAPAPVSAPEMPISSGSILESFEAEPAVDVDFSSIDETRPSPGAAKKPGPSRPLFFDVGEAAPSASEDLFSAEPAPFDPKVPPLPPVSNDDSGLIDIRMMARVEKERSEPKNRADFDLFNLSGGLFDEGGGELGPPDADPPARPALHTPLPPRPSRPPLSQRPIAPVLLPSSAPVVSERRPLRAATDATKPGARLRMALGAVALVAITAVVTSRLGSRSAERPDGAPSVSETTILPVITAAPPVALPTVDEPAKELRPPDKTPPVEPGVGTAKAPAPPPPVTATAREPVLEKAPPPVVEKPPPLVEKPPPVVEKPPPVVEKPPPVVEKPPEVAPPPSAGAEFDTAAARTALSAAAARAASCKPPEDPSGGAKVSVTFAPSGRVTTSRVTGPPYQGTAIGGCIASAFRSASVPPFDGAPVTVSRDVSLR